jgi:hypothetical protein
MRSGRWLVALMICVYSGRLMGQSVPASVRDTVVSWAIEDAKSDRDAGRSEDAARTEADARVVAAGPELRPVSPLPANLFPTIPDLANNPYARDLFSKEVEKIDLDERFTKGEIKIHSDSGGWNYIVLSSEARDLLLAYFHPQSKYRGDNRLLLRSLRILENGFDGWLSSDKTLADFGTFDTYTLDYLMLKSAMPGAILPSKKEKWEKAIAANAKKVSDNKAASWNQPGPNRTYLNADVRYMNGIAYAGAVLGRKDLTDLAAKALIWNSGALLPDGAFNYLGNQTECFTYHDIDVWSFAMYYLFTGDQRALDIIRKTTHYYPLSLDPRGVAEYYTAASWKHAWNTSKGENTAALVTCLTGDPQNARIAQGAKTDFVTACFYKRPVTPAPAPDNYILDDGNILGPRGRFGDFSFAGVLRDPSSLQVGPWGLGMGRGTIVGAMQLDPENQPTKSHDWPLNACVNGVSIGIRVKPTDDPSAPEDIRRTLRYMMQDIHGKAIVRPTIATIAASYHLTDKTDTGNIPFAALPWVGHQLWVMLPDRLVGWIELAPEGEQKTLGVLGRIELLSGRASWGVKKDLVSAGDGHFTYGKLALHITEQNLGQAMPQMTNGVYGGGDKKFILLNLTQPQQDLQTYSPDHPEYFVVEVRAAVAHDEAKVEKQKLPGGAWRLAVHTAQKDAWLYFNPTSASLSLTDSLHTLRRIASLQTTGDDSRRLTNSGADIPVAATLPADGSCLIIATDSAADHATQPLTYDQVFGVSK